MIYLKLHMNISFPENIEATSVDISYLGLNINGEAA